MVAIILSIVFIALLIYMFRLAGWIDVWIRGPLVPEAVSGEEGITVIIPFRNEEAAFGRHLHPLLIQAKDAQRVELIFVNDHSSDKGPAVVGSYVSGNVRLLHAKGEGKKNAVSEGVREASFPYIVTLDADISVPEGWIEQLKALTRSQASLIILPLVVKGAESAFGKIQEMEFMSLYAVTGATAMNRKPMMCNGAHLMFSKAFYERSKDHLRMNISSGDDMFLMEAATENDPVIYANDKSLTASMLPESSFRSFIRQRVRWSGKTKHLRGKHILLFGVLVVFLQFSFLMLCVLAGYGFVPGYFPFLFYLLKTLLDVALVNVAAYRTGQHFSLYYCVLLSLIYPLYGFIVPVLGWILKPVWKGRTIKT